MPTQHLDFTPGSAARVVFSHGLAFFTGHAAPQFDTLGEQTAALLKRYDELLAKFGLLKKNVLYAATFLKNADDEEEFHAEYRKWIDKDNPPAGYSVTGIPIQHSPIGDNVLIELQLIVATDPDAKIERFDLNDVGCRMVKYDGMCYFTGHVAPKYDTLAEQTAGVLARYDELFAQFGLDKKNVVMQYGFIKDINEYDEIGKPMDEFYGENPPAGVVVQACPRQTTAWGDKIKLELALFVACGDNPQIVRRDVSPSMARVVEYNGLAWFTGHSARPEFHGLKDQTKAVTARYDELFEQFGYKKQNLVAMYGFVKDIEKYKEFSEIESAWQDPQNPAAGVLVQALPSGDDNELELQYILSLDD